MDNDIDAEQELLNMAIQLSLQNYGPETDGNANNSVSPESHVSSMQPTSSASAPVSNNINQSAEAAQNSLQASLQALLGLPSGPSAAPQAHNAGQPAQPPAAQDNLLAALQSFFQQAAAGATSTAPPRSAASSRQAHNQQRASTVLAPLPGWTKVLTSWEKELGSSASVEEAPVNLEASEMAALVTVLSSAFNRPVVTSAADKKANNLYLGSKISNSVHVLASRDVDFLIESWKPAPEDVVASFHRVYEGLPKDGAVQGAVLRAVELVSRRIIHTAMDMLMNDDADIYFTEGVYVPQFLVALRHSLVRDAFLSAMLASREGGAAAKFWSDVLKRSIQDIGKGGASSSSGSRTAGGSGSSSSGGGALGDIADLEGRLLALDILCRQNVMLKCLANSLLQEVQRCRTHEEGARWLSSLLLGPLLAQSSIPEAAPTLVSGKVVSSCRELLTGVKGYPSLRDISPYVSILHTSFTRIQDAAHHVLKRVATLKDGGAGREAVVSWACAVADMCSSRTQIGAQLNEINVRRIMAAPSDPVPVNLLGAVLRLCRPFLSGYLQQNPKFADLFTRHLSPSYYTHQPNRVGDLSKQASLAGERGQGIASAIPGPWPGYLLPGDELPGPSSPTPLPSFIADMFFLAQKLFHVGMMPAVRSFYTISENMRARLKSARGGGEEGDEEGGAASMRGLGSDPAYLELRLHADLTLAHLLEPSLADDLVCLCMVQICWLDHLLRSTPADTFFTIPDYVLLDTAAWLTFVINNGQAELVASKPIGLLMTGLTHVLDSSTMISSPVVSQALVDLLLTMMAPTLQAGRSRSMLGPTMYRPGEAALVAGVLGTPAAQGELVSALLRKYIASDFVVGVDVDVDTYDKYSLRHHTDQILAELWRDDVCRRGMVELASSSDGGELFCEYAGAALNTLIYTFKDSLDRLDDIHKIEVQRSERTSWEAMPPAQRAETLRFYEGQKRTARGFLKMAVDIMKWLSTLTGTPQIASAVLRGRVRGRAAYAMLHFLELLAGPRCAGLVVEAPESYGFDRLALLGQVAGLMLRLAAGESAVSFAQAVLDEADFDEELLVRVQALLEESHQVVLATQLEQFIACLRAEGARRRGVEGQVPTPPKRRRSENGAGEEEAGTSGAAASPFDTNEEGLEDAYRQELEAHQFGTFDALLPRAFLKELVDKAASTTAVSAARAKRLAREMRDLQSRTRPPCEAAAAIFVRQDATRPDMVKAALSGPEGTPYAFGLFFFDTFFPAGYPDVPPVVLLATTGGGRMRFNPNLYADGKVCLSLLGTWHGGHESEKWNPASSSLFQVLVSIQSMILVEDPYFNEPNVDLMRGKSTFADKLREYNSEIRLGTMRWAMVDVLRSPPPGFEDVVQAHFRTLRPRIVRTARTWITEAEGLPGNFATRMQVCLEELTELLAAL